MTGGAAPRIEYRRPEWRTDPAAADAEARRRVALARDAPDPADREEVFLSDLIALTAIPDGLGEVEGLRSLIVGDDIGPDGETHHGTRTIRDFGALAEAADLVRLNLAYSGLTALAPLAGLVALQTLDLSGAQVADLAPLAGLAALQTLNLSSTHVADLAPLAGLPALQTLHLLSTEVTNLVPIASLAALQALDLRYTSVIDLVPLAGLAALQTLRLSHSQVADLTPLLSLPRFAALEGAELCFTETPAAASERRLEMLAGLSPGRAAVETVQYLRGEHPDLQPPAQGGATLSGLAALAAGSPVAVEEVAGRAVAVDRAPAGPPVRLDPAELAARADGLRTLAAHLIEDMQDAQAPRALVRRLQGYRDALPAGAPPVYFTLDGLMAMIRADADDGYLGEALPSGTLAGLRALVAGHDDLAPFFRPQGAPAPDEAPSLPAPDLAAVAPAETAAQIDAVREAVATAAAEGAVVDGLVRLVETLTEMMRVAQAPPIGPPDPA